MAKRPINLMALSGGRSRNDSRLGAAALYSAKVKHAAKNAINTASCAPSSAVFGSNNAGVSTSAATQSARISAPAARLITTTPFQTGQPRYVPRACPTLLPPGDGGTASFERYCAARRTAAQALRCVIKGFQSAVVLSCTTRTPKSA